MSEQHITNETFHGLAFPVARVRYAGPTDSRDSRYIATIRRDNERTYRVTFEYDDVFSPGQNAQFAALACFAKALADNDPEANVNEYVAIPGDLSADSYVFTFVPRYIFDRRES